MLLRSVTCWSGSYSRLVPDMIWKSFSSLAWRTAGTTKKSIDTKSVALFFRNVFLISDGGWTVPGICLR